MKLFTTIFFVLMSMNNVWGQEKVSSANNTVIYNGVPWFDDKGHIVNAHGACIVEDDGKYYLFGEYKTDSVNMFIGFSCYSSTDLVNWTFERLALPQQKDGPLGPDRVGERVKVMKSPATGEYVMYMHTDDRKYTDPQVGYATSKTINGEYTFQGPLLYEGEPIRKWDMGTFQDHDGTGYLLMHHGDIYRLSADFRSAADRVVSGIPGSGESPAMFHEGGTYYLLSSGLTSWQRNDNMYHTAPSIEGPWTKQGVFAPEGTLTHNSQCSFVFPVKSGKQTQYMYMGDRWSYPRQGQAATQVWLPLKTKGTTLSIPTYWAAWDVTTFRPVNRQPLGLPVNQQLKSNQKGDFVTIPFNGAALGLVGRSGPDGGYARISIVGKGGDTLQSSLVDFYSKVTHSGLRFVSPAFPEGDYTLHVEVAGEQGVWRNKRGDRFGSTDFWVRIEDVKILSENDSVAAREYLLPSDNKNNPVIHGYYADPEILYAEKTGKYYLYPTSDGFHNWAGYRFKVFSSSNLRDWKDEGVMLDLRRDTRWASNNAWAPCIIEKKTAAGYKYYYYYSAAKNIGVAVADEPTGPFTDLGKPIIPNDTTTRSQEIDPDVMYDPASGKYFLYWGSGYMRVAELNEDMTSIKKETIKVLTPKSTYREGTYVVHRKNKYYFFWSENDTRDENYRVRYAISDSPTGPLMIPESNLILTKDTTKGIYGTGHHSVIRVPDTDEWYMVYHRFRRPNAKGMGWAAGYNREVCIDRMEFSRDGTIKVVVPTL